MNDRALVLFSGGQDSTTCLAWALEKFAYVETIGFDYGQRHRVELECRASLRTQITAHFPAWAGKLGADHVFDLGVLKAVGENSLTSDIAITMQANGLPNSFVPGRNLLFLTLAAAHAYRQGIDHLVGGMCDTDYSGYPDCRDGTMKAMQTALNLGMDAKFTIQTPLMELDKAQIWALAEKLGGTTLVNIIRSSTHTCYLGNHAKLNDWGYGCGTCPACVLRRDGYAKYVAR